MITRAFPICAALCAGTVLHALPPSRDIAPPADYATTDNPDQAEGAKILREFRQMGIAGNYYLEFNLRMLPRHGPEREIAGRLWGGRNETGPISRIELRDGAKVTGRLLLQNGPDGRVWSWRPGSSQVGLLDSPALFNPVTDGADLTPFDLQMPFLYWNNFAFEGVRKLRGRPANVFVLNAPPEIAARINAPAAVRVCLDTRFGALVQAEYLKADKTPLKTLSVLDLKKIGEQWIVKSIDMRDEISRNKTRFEVTGAAVQLDFSGVVFTPAELPEAIQPPGRITRF